MFPAAASWLPQPPPRLFPPPAWSISAASARPPSLIPRSTRWFPRRSNSYRAPIAQWGIYAADGRWHHGPGGHWSAAERPFAGRSARCPGLKFLEGAVQPGGGIYAPKLGYNNYETCIAINCFVAANADKRYDKIIKNAEKYLKATQWTEAQNENDPDHKLDKSDPFYGGAGYGKNKRPDLSNTAFLVDALKEAGNGPDDEAMKKALVFVSRCQNLESEYNTTPLAAKNPDGGFYYTPANGGESAAEKLPNGGLRSYASMTYSGLKSMIYCGLKADDPRVKAATKWIKENYDLTTNPGLGQDGLYYYYHVFAKALDAMGSDTLVDSKGVKHDWRKDLVAELASQQQPDGSWVNTKSKSRRWFEGDPNLVTGYALLSLSYCRPK